jgi:ketosteroid isomerase-like protein
MDASRFRSMFEEHFARSRQGDAEGAHAIYREDAVLEFPQSGERFEGVENFREWRSQYPAETSFEIGEVRGEDDVWVMELTVTYDGGPKNYGVSIYELRAEKIARETIYVAEGFDPPEWRARWRSGA